MPQTPQECSLCCLLGLKASDLLSRHSLKKPMREEDRVRSLRLRKLQQFFFFTVIWQVNAETGSSPHWLVPDVSTLKNPKTGGTLKCHVKDSPGFPSAILLAVVLAYNHQCILNAVFLLFVHVLPQNHLDTTRIQAYQSYLDSFIQLVSPLSQRTRLEDKIRQPFPRAPEVLRHSRFYLDKWKRNHPDPALQSHRPEQLSASAHQKKRNRSKCPLWSSL